MVASRMNVDAELAEIFVVAPYQTVEPFDHVAGAALQHLRSFGPHKRIVVFQQLDHRLHWIRCPYVREPAENRLFDGARPSLRSWDTRTSAAPGSPIR
jgi:uncharacterized protein YifN (PemK superfamily)